MCFMILDLALRFQQIGIEIKDVLKTTWTEEIGYLNFARMPLDPKNTPFQRVINCWHSLEIRLVWMNDSIVYSRTIHEHVMPPGRNFENSPRQTRISGQGGNIFGNYLKKKLCGSKPKRWIYLENINHPQSQKNINSFLGVAADLHLLPPNFSKQMNNKNKIWNSNVITSWKNLRELYPLPPLLVTQIYPNYRWRYRILMASRQIFTKGYPSKTLCETEARYSGMKKSF